MELLVLRQLWGVTEAWETFFPKLKNIGYKGIESRMPPPERRARFADLLQEYDFRYIPMIFTEGVGVDDHAESFARQVDEALRFTPKFVNSHGGSDAWSEDESARFFEKALQIQEQNGVTVTHETHRGRIMFNPWVTDRMLSRFDALRLCCDFSHWVCVCERLIDDQIDIIRRCADHAHHIHARIGYEEGPQAPDPRAPEYAEHVAAHERWWNMIWTAQEQRGMTESTLTPEFGPPGYMHTLPYTNVPVADLEAICDWQAQRQMQRFAARRSGV